MAAPLAAEDWIDTIAGFLGQESRLRGLLLAGSHGRGTADRFSDIDLVALAAEADHTLIASRFRQVLEAVSTIVFWNERNHAGILVNAITADWLRCDLSILKPEALTGHARDTVRVLIDRDGVLDRLPDHVPHPGPNPARIRYLVNEFIRVLGLTHVVVGRGEYVTASVGLGLQRDHLTSLFLEDIPVSARGGALHLSRVLTPEQMQILTSLPAPGLDEGELIAAHIHVARCFFPPAREAAMRLGIPWPTAFEEATRSVLQRAFGAEHDISW